MIHKDRYIRSYLMFARGILVLMSAALFLCADVINVHATEESQDIAEEEPENDDEPETDPVDDFLSRSAFIGNSVGEGLTMYNNYKGKVPLGNATMLTRVSYAFYNDMSGATQFLPRYNGVPMRAAAAVKACGAEYVFICMGTNDLVGSAGCEKAYENYQQYIAGILKESPNVTIFIESCTPSRPGSNVNNDKIRKFNAYMSAYCDINDNMYYVDIATPLSDSSGYLAASLSSDGSVHLTNGAYAIWADTVRSYIAQFLADKVAQLVAENELNIEKTRADNNAAMHSVEEKKQQARQVRLAAEQKEQEKIEEKRRYDLLNVPDEVTIMHTLTADKSKKEYGAAYVADDDKTGLFTTAVKE